SRSTALCGLRDFAAAVALLHTVRARLGSTLSAYELMWANYYDCVLEVTGLRSPFAQRYPLYALLETEGFDQDRDQAAFDDTLSTAFDAGVVADAVIAQSERDVQHFWEIRDGIGEIQPRLYPAIVFDVSLPLDAMPPFLEAVDGQLAD